MQVYTVDLAVWWREKRWVALLEFIDGLPGASRLNEAIANDQELAAILAQEPEPTESWTPRVSEYGLTEMILSQIADGIKALQQTSIAVAGGKPGEMKPFPSPRTAVDLFRAAKERQELEEAAALFGFDPSDL
jgi:hypothetical protein